MSINKNNLEEYIFDYLEGNLSEKNLIDFKSYINSNSDAKAELEDWKQTYLSSNTELSSSAFSSLKKTNSTFYWSISVAVAFLLGIAGATYIHSTTVEESSKTETTPITKKVEEPNNYNQVEFKEEIQIEEKIEPINNVVITTTESIKAKNKSTLNHKIEEERIEEIEHLKIDLNRSKSKRKADLIKIRIKKTSAKKSKKNKTVDVIDLNTTGF